MKVVTAFLLCFGVVAALWVLGPREPLGGPAVFDPDSIGPDIDAYLYEREKAVPRLRREAQKHVLWADPAQKLRTEYAIVYIHGFSATLEEVRPVPDLVAAELGANIFFTRLAGHGRDGAAMAEASVPSWRMDLAEALEIGRRIGEKVIVIGTSTGATLVTLALAEGAPDVAGAVMISPNFGVKERGASLLTLPFARQILPAVIGRERGFVPENEEHGRWWTTRYPTTALLPMAASVKAALAAPVGDIRVPALFIFSDSDAVVDARATRRLAARWGGPVSLWPVRLRAGDDRLNHVVAGRILSPGMTGAVVERVVEWVAERGL